MAPFTQPRAWRADAPGMEHRAVDEYLRRVDALLQECAAPPPPAGAPAAPASRPHQHLYPNGVFDPRAGHPRRR